MRPTQHRTFQDILDKSLEQKGAAVPLPNVKEIEDPAEALKAIASCHGEMHVPYGFKLDERRATWYPKIFTRTRGMGSGFDGSGVILTTEGRAFSFVMCEHDWDESGANHSRGWHPSVCKKCGFDASIDSGD